MIAKAAARRNGRKEKIAATPMWRMLPLPLDLGTGAWPNSARPATPLGIPAISAWQAPSVILYRLILSLIFPAILARLLWRVMAGREMWRDLIERLGGGAASRGVSPVLWLHGASNGELASAREMIAEMLSRAPELRLIVSANTVTGRAFVESWGQARISARLAPLDHRLCLRRFLDHWRPKALIVLENELWPNRMHLCALSGVPVLVIGARMSAASARKWARLPGLSRQVIGAIRYLSAQDEASQRRFSGLGLESGRIGPLVNLKSGAAPVLESSPPTTVFMRQDTVLAASTHDGEEALVLEAFVAARAARPALRLILAPRHPRRRDAIEAEITRRGLGFATRSRGQAPDAALPVYLADTMGEMDLWYAAAGVCFVGGSLGAHGGHTPFEPATHGAVILHGPHVANSAPAYAALGRAGASIMVTDATTLAQAIVGLADPLRQAALGNAAREALLSLRDADAVEAFFQALSGASGIASLQK